MEGIIYELIDNTNNNKYIGSTETTIEKRLSSHKASYKSYLKGNKKQACKSFEILKNNNYTIKILEKVKYNEKEELLKKEAYYINNIKCINLKVPLQTRKEYRLNNVEKIKERNKKYYGKNKSEIYQKNRQRILKNHENYKQQCKDYYNNNKEKLKVDQKKYGKKYRDYQNSWGGDKRSNNNLLQIDTDLFL